MKTKLTKKTEIEKLYHLSLQTPTKLTPRIPKDRLKGEDDITPRISLCPTIEDCFRAAPWAVSYFEKKKYKGEDRELIRVLEFDIKNIGMENILDNEYITKHALVPDAPDTNEFWAINKTIEPDAIYYIYPYSMDYAYLMDYECISADLHSYIKIKEGAISEDIIKSTNGKMFPWELGIKEKDTEFIIVESRF